MIETVNIILLIVLGFFVLFGFIFGFIRGLWKTTFRTVWLVLTIMLALILAPIITNNLLDFPINASLAIEELNIETITTIRDTIHIALDHFLTPNITVNYPGLAEIIVSIPSMILNIVFFIVIFFLLKILLLPISAIIYNLCTGSSKKANTVMTSKDGKKTKPVKKSKHRFVGAMATGVVVSFSILMPVSAITNIVQKNNLSKSLDDIIGTPIVSEYIEAYNSSVVGNIYKYSGLAIVADSAFDALTTIKVDSTHTIKLSKDLPTAIQSYSKVMNLMSKANEYMGAEFNYKALTKAQAQDLLNEATALLEELSNVTTLSSLNDYIIPVMIDYLEHKEIKLNEDAELNTAMYNTLKSLGTAVKNGTNINVFDELKSIVNIASYLNEHNILLPLLQGDKVELGVSILSLDDEFSADLSNKIFALETVNVTAPNLVNVGLLALSKTFDIPYDSTHLSTSTQIKNAIGDIIGDILDVYTTLDFESTAIFTDETFASVGRLLDTIKSGSIIDTETYNGLVEFGIHFLSSTFKDSIPADFQDLFETIFEVLPDNIIGVNSWESELTIIQQAMDLMTGENGVLTEGFDAKNEAHLKQLGKTLDKLATTDLLSGKVELAYVENSLNKVTSKPFIEFIMFEAMDELKPLLQNDIDSTFGDLLDILDDVKLNIVKSTYNPKTQSTYWEDEFTKLAPTMNIILSTMDGNGIELDATTGQALDKLRTSNLFGDDATTKVVSDVIDIVKDSIDFGNETISETVQDVLQDVSLRIESTTLKEFIKTDPKFWETEMTHISSLMDIEFNGSDAVNALTATGATIDDIVYGNIPTTRPSALLTEQDFRKIIATSIGSMKETLLGSLSSTSVAYTAVSNAIGSITKNYYDATNSTHESVVMSSFEQELTHLASLKDVDPNVFTHADSSKALTLGTTLDNIAYNQDVNNNSDTITKEIINKIIVDCLPMINESTSHAYVNTAVISIKDNIRSIYNGTLHIVNWKTELVHLYNIANIEGNLFDSFDEFTSATATKVGGILDGIIYNYTTTTKDESKNSKIATETIVNTLVTSLMNSVKYPDATATESEKLTNKILTNSANPNIIEYTAEKTNAYTYTNILEDLAYIKGEVNNISNLLDAPTLSSLTEDSALSIDMTLENCQARKICGVITARDTAIFFIEELTNESYRSSANYAKALYEHYSNNASSETAETYYDSTDSSTYTDTTNFKNGFVKLYNEYKSI